MQGKKRHNSLVSWCHLATNRNNILISLQTHVSARYSFYLTLYLQSLLPIRTSKLSSVPSRLVGTTILNSLTIPWHRFRRYMSIWSTNVGVERNSERSCYAQSHHQNIGSEVGKRPNEQLYDKDNYVWPTRLINQSTGNEEPESINNDDQRGLSHDMVMFWLTKRIWWAEWEEEYQCTH